MQQLFALACIRIANHTVVAYDRVQTASSERAGDIRDVGRCVLALLAGVTQTQIEVPADSILIAEELSPSDIASLDRSKELGFCTTTGGARSHVAILADVQAHGLGQTTQASMRFSAEIADPRKQDARSRLGSLGHPSLSAVHARQQYAATGSPSKGHQQGACARLCSAGHNQEPSGKRWR